MRSCHTFRLKNKQIRGGKHSGTVPLYVFGFFGKHVQDNPEENCSITELKNKVTNPKLKKVLEAIIDSDCFNPKDIARVIGTSVEDVKLSLCELKAILFKQ